jgi:hypothetical protein
MTPPLATRYVPIQTHIPAVPAGGVLRSLAGAALGTFGCCPAVGPSCSWCCSAARQALQHGRQSCHQYEQLARWTLLPSCELHICGRCEAGSWRFNITSVVSVALRGSDTTVCTCSMTSSHVLHPVLTHLPAAAVHTACTKAINSSIHTAAVIYFLQCMMVTKVQQLVTC